MVALGEAKNGVAAVRAKNQSVLWLGRGAVPPAVEQIAIDAGFTLQLRTAPDWPAARVAWLQSLPSTNRDNSSLARRRIAILHPDPGAADALAEAVRAKGARAVVLSLSDQGLIRAEALDPEVIILSPAHMAGACRQAVDAVWAHKRLRWTPMLLVPDERLGPAGLDAPDVRELAISVGMLCAEHVFLGRRAQMESCFEVALHQLGPTRTLAALLEAGRPLRACFRSAELAVEVDVTEGIVVGARAGRSEPEEGTLLGVHALAALYELSHATVVVRHVEHPAVTNVMAPLDALLLSEHRAPFLNSEAPKVDVDALLVPALSAPHLPRAVPGAIADAKPYDAGEHKPAQTAPAAAKLPPPALFGAREPGQSPLNSPPGTVADLKKTLMGVGLPPLVALPPTAIRAPSQPGLLAVPMGAAVVEAARTYEKGGESGLEKAVANALGGNASNDTASEATPARQVEAALVDTNTPTRAFSYPRGVAEVAEVAEVAAQARASDAPEIEVLVSEWPAGRAKTVATDPSPARDGESTETWMMPAFPWHPSRPPRRARGAYVAAASASALVLCCALGWWWGLASTKSAPPPVALAARAVPPPQPVIATKPPEPSETTALAATPAPEVAAPTPGTAELGPVAAPSPNPVPVVTPALEVPAPSAVEVPAPSAVEVPVVAALEPAPAQAVVEPAKPVPTGVPARVSGVPQTTESTDRASSVEARVRADVDVLNGRKLRSQGDLAGARLAYLDALNKAPGYPRALAGLAETYLAQKDAEHALATTLQLLERRPSFPDDYRLLGDVHMLGGRTTEAAEAYLKASQGGSSVARERLKAITP